MKLIIQSVNSNKFSFLIVIIIFIIILDTLTIKTSIFFTMDLLSYWRILLFFVISVFIIGAQYIILKYIKSKIIVNHIKKKLYLDIISKYIFVIQLSLDTCIIITMYQIIINSFYYIILLSVAITLSYATAVILLAILSYRFLTLFKSENNYVIFLYGFSSILIALNIAVVFVFSTIILQDKSSIVFPHIGILIPIFEQYSGSLKDTLNSLYNVSFLVYYVIIWITTTLMLRFHSRKLGKIKFWLLASIPLTYVVIEFLVVFIHILNPFIEFNPVLFTLILLIVFWIGQPLGGILFGLIFWKMAQYVNNKNVKEYLGFSAFGLVLLMISNQAITVATSPSFPPFGLVSITFIGLSSYMLLIGISYTVISLLHDIRLRSSIRKIADELKLLDSIGSSAIMEDEQNKFRKINNIIKDNKHEMINETGIQPSLTDKDIKDYINDILNEKTTFNNE
jgi:hypothetical protein